jgi:hypothetical protein
MPAKEKVGAWLGNASAADDDDEYDSDGSDAPNGHRNGYDGAESATQVREAQEVDWETVLPLVRPALEDPSDKRRKGFVARYLVVGPECEFASAMIVGAAHMAVEWLMSWWLGRNVTEDECLSSVTALQCDLCL